MLSFPEKYSLDRLHGTGKGSVCRGFGKLMVVLLSNCLILYHYQNAPREYIRK